MTHVLNPMFILHLTDFHLSESGDTSKIEDRIYTQLNDFINSKKRNYFDLICITGDMMDRNGFGKGHDKAINFINKLKSKSLKIYKQGYTKIICCPGNHDIDFSKSLRFKNSELRNSFFVEGPDVNVYDRFKSYDIVDENYDKLKEKFVDYKNFVKAIDADNLKVNSPNPHLHGVLKLNAPNDKKIFISWFNTNWLCLLQKDWKNLFESDKSIINKCISKQESKEISSLFYDTNKISAGNNINTFIHNSFKTSEKEILFSLGMCHHYPRLLHWFDKYNFRNEDNTLNKSFYSHLSDYSIILNGHTHGTLYDKPFCTHPGIDKKETDPCIGILEVHLTKNFVVRHSLSIEKDLIQSELTEKSIKNFNKVDTFNDQSFLVDVKSNYCYDDIVKDLEWHDSSKNKVNFSKYLDALQNRNYVFEKEILKKINKI